MNEQTMQPNSHPNSQPTLQFQGIYKAFGPKRVLEGVDLAVAKGESIVIIGGSGTGKSVLLKCALGLLPADRGSVLIDGQNFLRMRSKQHAATLARFGMLFQGGALFDSLSVWENVGFRLLRRDRVKRSQARETAMAALAKVRLGSDVAALYPSEISGGMQKRVALARAIVAAPDFLFFDEPTAGLDPITADAINELIVTQTKALGATAVTITHDLASARKIADRVAMLHDGKIIWQGKPDQLENSGDARVDQFVHGRAEGPIQPTL